MFNDNIWCTKNRTVHKVTILALTKQCVLKRNSSYSSLLVQKQYCHIGFIHFSLKKKGKIWRNTTDFLDSSVTVHTSLEYYICFLPLFNPQARSLRHGWPFACAIVFLHCQNQREKGMCRVMHQSLSVLVQGSRSSPQCIAVSIHLQHTTEAETFMLSTQAYV